MEPTIAVDPAFMNVFDFDMLEEIHPDYPFDIKFFGQVLDNLYEKEESLSSLITLFSLIAVLISIVGVFGLVVFSTSCVSALSYLLRSLL